MLHVSNDHFYFGHIIALLLLFFIGFRFEVDKPLQGILIRPADSPDSHLLIPAAPVDSSSLPASLRSKLFDRSPCYLKCSRSVGNDKESELKGMLPLISTFAQ